MKQKIVTLPLVVIFLCIICDCNAQHQNYWPFGFKAGVDFRTGVPLAVNSQLDAHECSSSWSDENGNLVLYTDGTTVWDRNHNILDNGNNLSLFNTTSTSQGSVIIPVPGEKNKYYVFYSNSIYSSSNSCSLQYAIVDMTLNAGTGKVISKNNFIAHSLTEHMIVVAGDRCDFWLIVVDRINHLFKAFSIDANGVNPNPVTSRRIPGYGLASGNIGHIDVDTARKKLCMAQGNLVLYDLNINTGVISNPIVLDDAQSYSLANNPDLYYDLAFSPDNSKLYSCVTGPGYVHQFNVSSGDAAIMRSSKTMVGQEPIFGMQRGPDGKIYTSGYSYTYLSVINEPNSAGTACHFVPAGFRLLPATNSWHGLPSFALTLSKSTRYSSLTDTVFCDQRKTLSAKNTSQKNYVWQDGVSGPTRIITTSGVYWVRYEGSLNCRDYEYTDTFRIYFDLSTKYISTTTLDTGFCQSDTLTLKAKNHSGTDYTWNDGYTGSERMVNRAGIYRLQYRVAEKCTEYIDSFVIIYPDKDPEVSFTHDTIICSGAQVTYNNTSHPSFNNFNWHFGDGDSSQLHNPTHVYQTAGRYEILLAGNRGKCRDTAIAFVIVDSILPVTFSMDRNHACLGDSIHFEHQLHSHTIRSLYWQTGDGQTFDVLKANHITHTYTVTGRVTVTLKAGFRACPEHTYTDSVMISDLPDVSLGADGGICRNGPPVMLQNLNQTENGKARTYLWNTGARSETLTVAEPGMYHLTVYDDSSGCSNTDSVVISKDCYYDIPNAFSPDGDGINDYFFIGNILSKELQALRFTVFNRWGQPVFETQRQDCKGWDGTYKGLPVPMGVYVYLFEIRFANGSVEKYQGNVTVVR